MAGNPPPEAGSFETAIVEEFRDVEAHPQQPSADINPRPWIVRYLAQDINTEHADLIFLVCYFLSGLSDSSAYRAWGCFVSMQTGNTVFLGLGASDTLDQTTYHWLKALISILSFLVGSAVYSKTQYFSPQSRRTLLANFGSQTVIVSVAASLLQSGVIEDSGVVTDNHVFLKLIPLSLVAFQCAGQMAASRLLAFPEIPTTVLTSLYYDLVSDPGMLQPFGRNKRRNRRITSIIGVIGGSVIGGWLSKSTGRISPALWIVAASKFAISAIWLFWKQDGPKPQGNSTATIS
ncbi:hypothetical protein AJ78_03445 [Emergomyces pasteurianus Ep9510]|uniref:DUF1275 domain protein n=1 Tax=Emergomyces pasteurianus Ep9510 TaxID=1447872 RepID=A0A1J9QMD2_9EURO|nr:hypothetical protein AJ78_03445 [Emergomyces pasteurianus Ep9510]